MHTKYLRLLYWHVSQWLEDLSSFTVGVFQITCRSRVAYRPATNSLTTSNVINWTGRDVC